MFWGICLSVIAVGLSASVMGFTSETERLSQAIRVDDVTLTAARASGEAEVFFFASAPRIHREHAIRHESLSSGKRTIFILIPLTDEE